MVNLPMAQSSTGAEYRAASAIDIALGDLRQGLAARTSDARRSVPGQGTDLQHLRRIQIRSVHEHQARLELEPRRGRWPVRGSGRLHEQRGSTCRKPAGKRDHGHEDLAVRSRGDRKQRPLHHGGTDEEGDCAVREDQAVGDRMEIMVEFHSLWNLPTAKKIARRSNPMPPPGSRTRSA